MAFGFSNVYLGKVEEGKSKNGNELVFVQFVDQGFQPSPSMLYFGDKNAEQLRSLSGSLVKVNLGAGQRNFTVSEIEGSK